MGMSTTPPAALPPQVPQLPSAQVPPTPGQTEPEPVQVPLRQQPPPPQVFRSQHVSPGPPQGEQTPALQALPAAQASPRQQASPASPQLAQVPESQRPSVQLPSGQQASPTAPQLGGASGLASAGGTLVSTGGTVESLGIVESVGSNVIRFKPGDSVFGETIVTMQWIHGRAWAEYVSVSQDLLAKKPDNVTFEQAASVPTAGYIVLLNIRDLDELRPGRNVLINGAAGGVGSIALQLAKAQGAEVTAVDSTSKLDMLRTLGADHVIDYTQENFTQGAARYDLIFDIPGNYSFDDCRGVLKLNGRYVLIGHEKFGATGKRALGILPGFFKLMFRARFVTQLQGPKLPMPSRKNAIAILSDLLEAGKLTPIIDSTYPLREAGEALRHLAEHETHGKVVLRMTKHD